MVRSNLLLLLLLAPVGRAHADSAGEAFAVVPASSSLTYHLVHKLHKVDGKSTRVEGRARLAAGGQALVTVRAPVESFDSGNVNRDGHMKEAVEAARFPTVELKAIAEGFALPASFPATVDKTFKAQLSFHGVQQTFDVPVRLVFESATAVRATARFAVSLDAYRVERPSLLFTKVDDQLQIDAVLAFQR